MKPFLIPIIICVSLLIGLGRFTVPGHGLSYAGSYEAIAHIWVGFLIALMILKPIRLLSGLMLFAISGIEVAAFLMRGAAVIAASGLIILGSVPAYADTVSSVTIPWAWGSWLLAALQYVIYTIALPALATWVAVYVKDTQVQKFVSELLDKAADYAFAATEGVVKGKMLDIPATNATIATAEQYVIDNAPKWAKALGDTLRPKILARIAAKTPIAPEVTAANTGTAAWGVK